MTPNSWSKLNSQQQKKLFSKFLNSVKDRTIAKISRSNDVLELSQTLQVVEKSQDK